MDIGEPTYRDEEYRGCKDVRGRDPSEKNGICTELLPDRRERDIDGRDEEWGEKRGEQCDDEDAPPVRRGDPPLSRGGIGWISPACAQGIVSRITGSHFHSRKRFSPSPAKEGVAGRPRCDPPTRGLSRAGNGPRTAWQYPIEPLPRAWPLRRVRMLHCPLPRRDRRRRPPRLPLQWAR